MARRRLDLPTALDLLRAAWELALARRRLGKADARSFTTRGESPPITQDIDRIAFAIPRMAARVPWRSDCLVQALAAQRWLERQGIGSTIHIGVRSDGDRSLDAHAWLTAGDRVVVGGDVGQYARLS